MGIAPTTPLLWVFCPVGFPGFTNCMLLGFVQKMVMRPTDSSMDTCQQIRSIHVYIYTYIHTYIHICCRVKTWSKNYFVLSHNVVQVLIFFMFCFQASSSFCRENENFQKVRQTILSLPPMKQIGLFEHSETQKTLASLNEMMGDVLQLTKLNLTSLSLNKDAITSLPYLRMFWVYKECLVDVCHWQSLSLHSFKCFVDRVSHFSGDNSLMASRSIA